MAPTLPLGADLSLPGIARLAAEFLDRLNMDEVTLVGNDTGGPLAQLLMAEDAARVARVALVSCNAFDNFPPGLTGKTLVLSGKLSPAMFGLFMQQPRLRPARRLPITFGWLTKRGDGATIRWLRPVMTQPEIRRPDPPRLARRVPGARIETIPAGHLIHRTEPTAFTETILRFLQPARTPPTKTRNERHTFTMTSQVEMGSVLPQESAPHRPARHSRSG